MVLKILFARPISVEVPVYVIRIIYEILYIDLLYKVKYKSFFFLSFMFAKEQIPEGGGQNF